MSFWSRICLKVGVAAYLLLTSVYCLLAYLPYTYYAVIKAPPYEWLTWFVAHHALLYWLLLIAAALVYWPQRTRMSYRIFWGAMAGAGIALAVHPLLPNLQSNLCAYVWSLVALVLSAGISLSEIIPAPLQNAERTQNSVTYFPVVLAAITVSLLAILGTKVNYYRTGFPIGIHLKNFDLGAWAVLTHVVLAVTAISALNLVFAIAAKTARPRLIKYSFLGSTGLIACSIGIEEFLGSAFSFDGVYSLTYAILLTCVLGLAAWSLMVSLHLRTGSAKPSTKGAGRKTLWVAGFAGLVALTLALPSTVGQWDWNSVIQSVFTFLLWIGFTAGFYQLLNRPRTYSIPALVAILLICGCGYKALQLSSFIWSKSLGPTNEDVAATIETYASQNVSLRLASHLLGNAPPAEKCGELCRILRQYTNVRDAETTTEVKLVDHLAPAKEERPNIFIFVIDSMRPDYLGAYNPKVDFTPNIDSFAKDSIVFRNAYTQYAGTTLSEPAIWSGAMLLHAHYLRPFENVNSLEKLVKTDGYQMIMSYDSVLRELLSQSDQITKLDVDKKWNQLEMCSTVQELDHALDARSDKARAVFFYSQPMNVHMFARNSQPAGLHTGWYRPGFNYRISLEVHEVDGCMGRFVSDLKSRGMYDNSIIVLASDHGDATGEFGRRTHSYIIYPEVMRVPLIVHLPKSMQGKFTDDTAGIATLTDITPSLYYLLGHGPIKVNRMFGHPLFTKTKEELASYHRSEVFFASDEVAVYGLLEDSGRYLYATYDSPARSYLFDLASDPNAQHNVLTPEEKKSYDEKIIDYLKMIADYYGYKPGMGTLLSARKY